MTKTDPTPLITDDGEARAPTDAEYLWAVRGEDFGGFAATVAFIESREQFLRTAEKLGFARNTFLAFHPAKPGFIERAASALDSLLKTVQHAAE